MSAIRSSNMAWISAKSWRRSRLASTPTFTTSRPSAGNVSAKRRNSDRLPLQAASRARQRRFRSSHFWSLSTMQNSFWGYRRENGRVGVRNHVTIMRASKAAREYLQLASEAQRDECALNELWVSTKCGESDTTSGCGANPTVGDAFDKLYAAGCTLVFGETTELTGGEHIVAARCRDDKVRADFQRVFDRYQAVINRHKTTDHSDSQPTKGNIAGGLTTIEEKALGNIQKIGRKSVVDGVIDKAEMPTGPGLWFMDSSSAAAEMTTLCAASGFVVHFFPTGQGNVIGNPILPVIKISSNPRTVRTMSEHIDVDTSGLLQREITMDQAGDRLIDMMFRTVNGRLTAAEALGHREFVMTRLYESA